MERYRETGKPLKDTLSISSMRRLVYRLDYGQIEIRKIVSEVTFTQIGRI